jgi:hypothetical protein
MGDFMQQQFSDCIPGMAQDQVAAHGDFPFPGDQEPHQSFLSRREKTGGRIPV